MVSEWATDRTHDFAALDWLLENYWLKVPGSRADNARMARRAGWTGIGLLVAILLVVNVAVVVARTGTAGETTSIQVGSARPASLGSEALENTEPSTTVPPAPASSVTPPGQWAPTTTTKPKPSSTTTPTTRRPTTTSTTAPAPVAGTVGPGLHVVAPDGTGLLRLTDHNGGMFTWSPDGTRLAQSTGRELIIVRADGSGRTTLATAYGALIPVWSPDGRFIAYNDPDEGLLVVRTDGSSPPTLVDAKGYMANWTRDNRLVVLTFADVGIPATVVLYDLAGGRRVLAPEAGTSVDPAPSPDGRLVAYATDRIMVAAMDGSGSRPLTSLCCAADIFPWRQRWSPDSSQLLYQHYGDVWVVGAGGGNERLLAEKAYSPAWSPDGRSIALTDGREQLANGLLHSKLAIMPAGGGERRTVYDPGEKLGVGQPQWSPNGRQIAVIVTQNSFPFPP